MSTPPLELLACPFCRGELADDRALLSCGECGRRYGFEDDAPRLLLDEARQSEERAPGLVGRVAAAVASVPLVYDLIQRAAGADKIARRLQPIVASTNGALVLDVGAGTGNFENALPASARYLWLDADPAKLRGFRTKSSSPAILGDATKIPLRDRSMDWTVSIGVAHHLDDSQFDAMLDELRRVTRGRLLFLDGVTSRRRWSRLLWHYDRGRHPRSAEALRAKIARRFAIESAEEFTVLHTYLLVTAANQD